MKQEPETQMRMSKESTENAETCGHSLRKSESGLSRLVLYQTRNNIRLDGNSLLLLRSLPTQQWIEAR